MLRHVLGAGGRAAVSASRPQRCVLAGVVDNMAASGERLSERDTAGRGVSPRRPRSKFSAQWPVPEQDVVWLTDLRFTLACKVRQRPQVHFGMTFLTFILPSFLPQNDSRNMGMGPRWLTKNKYVEEWNGRREITEKAFNASGANVANIVFYAAVLPLGVYWLGRSELEKKGDRRYKDMC